MGRPAERGRPTPIDNILKPAATIVCAKYLSSLYAFASLRARATSAFRFATTCSSFVITSFVARSFFV